MKDKGSVPKIHCHQFSIDLQMFLRLLAFANFIFAMNEHQSMLQYIWLVKTLFGKNQKFGIKLQQYL